MKTSVLFLLLFLSAPAVADSASNRSADRVWLTNVIMVSPENLDHVERGSVLIESGRITRVERSPGTQRPAGVTVIDGHGQYLIPGLIDSHVHLANVPGMSLDQNETKRGMIQEYYRQLPRSCLYFGYTTVVDLAVSFPQVLDVFRQAPLHPDLYDCGGSLAFANGYPMSFLPPATRFQVFPNFIYDAKQAARIPPVYRPEDHSPAADVGRVKGSGGICVKTYFERGFADDKNLPVMGPEVLAEVRKAATQDGLVLIMHANSFEAQMFAVQGGVDVIAHGMWHWGKLDQRKELPEEIKRLLDKIAERRIGYQPTIQVLYGERAYFDHNYLDNPAIPKVVPKDMLEWFKLPEGKWLAKELNPDGASDAALIEEYEQGPMRRVRQVVSYLAGKDANILFGTDTPSSPTYGNLPGLNGYLEMRQLEKAGMSLAQIFKAATIGNAREFKLESQLGSIEPGKVANFLLMKKSPLETLDAYDTITTVWVHGQAILRENLSADANR